MLSIGIDFGGVLSIHDRGLGEATCGLVCEANGRPPCGGIVTGEHKSITINMPDALETLKSLKSVAKLYLISFAGKTRAKETRESILKTCPGLFDDLFFVKDKKFKKDVCKSLGCDIMIDDTVDILEDIFKSQKDINLLWFQGDPTFPEDQITNNPNIIPIQSWLEIKSLIENHGPKRNTAQPVDLSKKLYYD